MTPKRGNMLGAITNEIFLRTAGFGRYFFGRTRGGGGWIRGEGSNDGNVLLVLGLEKVELQTKGDGREALPNAIHGGMDRRHRTTVCALEDGRGSYKPACC